LGLLDSIVGQKEREVAELRTRAPQLLESLTVTHADRRSHDFAQALQAGECVAVIAEVKRRSPSAGVIHAEADPVGTAASYEASGARAISVLTDREYFGGSVKDLQDVVSAVHIPVLRKDFIINELQIVEARAHGASAILLIVRLLDAQQLTDLRQTAEQLGMHALVEIHNEAELDSAMQSGSRIIGINNRDLDTLAIDLGVSERILPRIPKAVIAIAESGLKTAADVQRMANAGADAVLVGEALMRESAETPTSHTKTHRGASEMACIPRTGR
jgi:indole-3-glycerol phosphate synthase